VHVLPPTNSTEESQDGVENSPESTEEELDADVREREQNGSDSDTPDTTDKTHPVPFIDEITQDGLLSISFSEEINVAANFTLVENGTVEVDG